MKGFKGSRISIASDTRTDDKKVGRELDTKPSMRNTLEDRDVQDRERGSILWVMDPPCGLKARRRYILHGHDRKAGQRTTCQLCWQERWYQGRGTKRTIFLLIETRRTNRKSSHPSVVTGMSTTIVAGSY